MKAVDWIVDVLIHNGVTDVFGIPGGVILDLLYALSARSPQIVPHLCFHEQAAGFAALGYAQVNGNLGVAYTTRGPGFTNLITAVADAYQESIPVLFITAHKEKTSEHKMRMCTDQELNAVSLVRSITKYAKRVDALCDLISSVQEACTCAIEDRKGPVVLDIHSALWTQEVPQTDIANFSRFPCTCVAADIVQIYAGLNHAKRPVILVGGGTQDPEVRSSIGNFAEEKQIPILSSRCSQDLFADSPMYFGYIGSHGLRYSNFILSKADLLFVLGNRMSFPLDSASYAPIFGHIQTIRIDIDPAELEKEIPHSIRYLADLKVFFRFFNKAEIVPKDSKWIATCHELKNSLCRFDADFPINTLSRIIKNLSEDHTLSVDVGNNEFWVSRAYAYADARCRILYSRSFGTLGCALPKAIGAYYQTKDPVLCITGDQGIQMNIQELQAISSQRLPVGILLLNNHSSGMIREHEKQRFGENYIHVTPNDGYSAPDFSEISRAYKIPYYRITRDESNLEFLNQLSLPFFVEIEIDLEVNLGIYLPKGKKCQDLSPEIDRRLYEYLNGI